MTFGSLDYSLFRAINGDADRTGIFDRLFTLYAQIGPFLIVAIVLIACFIGTRTERIRRRAAAFHAAVALGVGFLLNQIAGHIWDRARPFAAHHVHLLLARTMDSSFPSDHAMAGAAIAAAVFFYSPKLGAVLGVLAAALAVDRVFVGVHYPSDVLAGIAVGLAAALALAPARPLFMAAGERTTALLARLGLG